MAERIVLFSKQNGKPRVPLTMRINWLPDGTIKPLMYWTPDGVCYKVVSLIEGVSLAFLKERGEGLRFKVKAEIIETMEPNDNLLHTRYETWLYLTDCRFSEKNIIDERYENDRKEYVTVTLDVFPDGDYELVYFCVNGSRYIVEKTSAIEYRGSFSTGGVGIWHKVEVRLVNMNDDEDPNPYKSVRRTGAVYWELNKWFVSVAKPE